MHKLTISVFFVEAQSKARSLRCNAESLNEIAINQCIVLQEECAALNLKASSYTNVFLRCKHQLGPMQSVLQQHSIALCNLHVRNPDCQSGIMPQGTIHINTSVV